MRRCARCRCRLAPHGPATLPPLCRGYAEKKLTENIDCEIFGVVLEEARESYSEDIVRAMTSETEADRARNLAELLAWCATAEPTPKAWKANKKSRK